MRINSAVRCPDHNLKVGGVHSSAHLKGLAVDVKINSNVLRSKLIRSAYEMGCLRIGVAKTFVHLDIMEHVVDESMWLYY